MHQPSAVLSAAAPHLTSVSSVFAGGLEASGAYSGLCVPWLRLCSSAALAALDDVMVS